VPKWTDKVQKDDFDRMVRRGLTAVGIHLEGAALSYANRSVKTGRLKGSITYAVRGEQDEMRSPYNEPEDKMSKPSNKYTCYVGTNVDYAQHVEYGARGRPGKPYLRPALHNNRKECREIFKDAIKGMVRGQ